MIEIYQTDGTTTKVATLQEALKHYERMEENLTLLTPYILGEVLERLPYFDDNSRVNLKLMPTREMQAQIAKAVYRWRMYSLNKYSTQDVDKITKIIYNLVKDSANEFTCQFYDVTPCNRSIAKKTFIERVTNLYDAMVEFANTMINNTNKKIDRVGVGGQQPNEPESH